MTCVARLVRHCNGHLALACCHVERVHVANATTVIVEAIEAYCLAKMWPTSVQCIYVAIY